MKREDILKRPAYWFESEQNELFRQVSAYMQNENINRTELAKRLNVSKGYVSQILNGNFNYTLKKLIEICLAIGIVPNISYQKLEKVISDDKRLRNFLKSNVALTAQDSFLPVKVFKLKTLTKTNQNNFFEGTNLSLRNIHQDKYQRDFNSDNIAV